MNENDFIARITDDLACRDCAAEIRVTRGSRGYRARVIHRAVCPWHARHRAGEVTGAIPCSTTVTHRGPYQNDPGR